MKSQYKITGIQRIYINNDKCTRFEVWELIDNTWVYQFSSRVDNWYKTNRGITSQISRQEHKWGHEASFIL